MLFTFSVHDAASCCHRALSFVVPLDSLSVLLGVSVCRLDRPCVRSKSWEPTDTNHRRDVVDERSTRIDLCIDREYVASPTFPSDRTASSEPAFAARGMAAVPVSEKQVLATSPVAAAIVHPPAAIHWRVRSSCVGNLSSFERDSSLVDPASSYMLVSKIKPCMSQYKLN